MKINGNPISTERSVTIIKEKILNKCEKLPEVEERLAYLKKVIGDCQRIINLAEKTDGKYLDINFLLKEEPDIDEYLIMFLDGLCEPAAVRSTDKAGKKGKIPWVVKQPRKYYKVSLADGGRVCDIQIAFGGIKSFKEDIKNQLTVIEAVEKNAGDSLIPKEERIKTKSSFSDIVRIFEGMKATGIISIKTPVKEFAELFFSDISDKLYFERKYNSTKNRIEKEKSSSNSKELLYFILYLIEKAYKGKEEELEKIIKYAEEMQKNMI